jgi:peroxiredoxin
MSFSGAPAKAKPPSVAEAAPELVLPTLEGGAFSLADARGQPVLVSFLRHGG